MSETRRIVVASRGLPTSDGAGVTLTRLLGTPHLPDLDPFLMLDHFGSDEAEDYLAGFPDHPHRGFETVTVMKEGRMRHRDSRGNEGVVGPGGIQWMTTGRGLVHSEMPEQTEGAMSGFQLWVNLPAAKKMILPRWFDHPADSVPTEKREGAFVRVLTGTTGRGTTGPAVSAAQDELRLLLLDVTLAAGGTFEEALPTDQNAFVAVYGGEVSGPASSGTHVLPSPSVGVLSRGSTVSLTAGLEGGRFLLAAGNPLREPVARHGPFVMNTQQELRQAFGDFQAGRLG